jgi:hypothetical protein
MVSYRAMLIAWALSVPFVPPVMSMMGPVVFNLNFTIVSNVFFLPMRVTSGTGRNLDTLCNTKEADIDLHVVYWLLVSFYVTLVWFHAILFKPFA